MTLYHGSGSVLRPGDIVEARHWRGWAYASHQLHTARIFGKVGTYEVEPLDPSDVIERHMKYDNDEGHLEVVSSVGFRVIREVPADEHDPARQWVALDGLRDHRRVGQRFGLHDRGRFRVEERGRRLRHNS